MTYMLKRYYEKNIDEFMSIPFTANRFKINVDGVVIDNDTSLVQRKKRPMIVFTSGESVSLDVGVLVGIVFKKNLLPHHLWSSLELFYLDDNPDNVHPSNLLWKNKDHGLEVLPGFFWIPGFSRYAINSEGVVKNIFSEATLSPYVDNMGYWMFGVTPDVGKRTIVGKHRLLALAFKEYPINVCDLDVNHEDGVKSNCALWNLEWNSRKQNCDHAYSTGLRIDNKPVLVKNLYTGNVREFYSIEECARQIGVDGETIRLRCRFHGQKVFIPGFLFKFKDDDADWINVPADGIVSALYRTGVPRPLEIFNQSSGDKWTFNTPAIAGRYFDISAYRLKQALVTKKPVNGLIVKLLEPDKSLISW